MQAFITRGREEAPVFTGRGLFALIWPLLVEQLLSVFVGMVDVLMVAAVGEAAVSGVSLVDSVNILILQVLFAICAGGTVVCARSVGKKDALRAGRTTAQMLLITVAGMAVITVLFLLGGRSLLRLIFGQVEAPILANADTYLLITCLSFPFLAMYNSGASALRACGNTRSSMAWSLVQNIINIAGNALCIFVLKMGVAGVALPTLAARAIGAVGILRTLQSPQNPARLNGLTDFRPERTIIRDILSIGIPNSIESGIFQFGKLTLQSLVATLGSASIAGFAVASNLVTYFYLPGNTLGAALLTIIGQCTGAGRPEQAKQYTKLLMLVNYALLAVICTLFICCRGFLIGMYRLSDEAAVLATGLMVSHAIAMVIWPLGFLTPYYFRATGRARFTMVVSIAFMWIFRIGFAYLFIRLLHMNVLGAWYAMYVDWVARILVYTPAFLRSRPKLPAT